MLKFVPHSLQYIYLFKGRYISPGGGTLLWGRLCHFSLLGMNPGCLMRFTSPLLTNLLTAGVEVGVQPGLRLRPVLGNLRLDSGSLLQRLLLCGYTMYCIKHWFAVCHSDASPLGRKSKP
jgi:hypothetical protein